MVFDLSAVNRYIALETIGRVSHGGRFAIERVLTSRRMCGTSWMSSWPVTIRII